jgi:flagellar basal-body rod modification protein FlgD
MTVSALSAVTGTETPSTSTTSTTSTTLGKDDFLKLLITQLQNQDPLNPSDSTEFASQLAQFSSLEQLNNINESLSTLNQYQASINNAQAVSFIGKEIESKGNTVEMKSGQSVACEFELAEAASTVTVSIYDSSGAFVKDVTATGLSAGKQTVTWDGKDRNGSTVAEGTYTFEVQAYGASKETVEVTTYSQGTVTGVSFNDGITYLSLGSGEVALGDVVRITQK